MSLRRRILLGLSVLFMVWSGLFIANSSLVGADGKRYFCLFDDGMISMRYAWHLANGYGLVWNPGEWVEGYTNLLLTLLMTVANLLLSKPYTSLAIQVLGVGLMLANAGLAVTIADRVFGHDSNSPKPWPLIASVLLFVGVLSYYPLVYWSLMGMETGLLCTLLLLAVVLMLRALDRPNSPQQSQLRLLAGMGICLGLAYLTRPDSVIPAAPILAYLLLALWQSGLPFKKIAQRLTILMGIYALFPAVQMAFRWLYYGELAPNTYTLKVVGMPLAERVANGIGFLQPFFTEMAVVLAVVGLLTLVRWQLPRLMLVLVFAALLVWQVWVGGDPWRYWRMMAPAMPLLLMVLIDDLWWLAGKVGERLPSQPLGERLAAVLVVVAFVGAMIPVNERFWPEMNLSRDAYTVPDNQVNLEKSLLILTATDEGARVAVTWAGAIPYFTGRYAIDILGKSDKRIARLAPDLSGAVSWNGMNSVPGHNKYDLNYSLNTLHPDVVLNLKWGGQDVNRWGAEVFVPVVLIARPYVGLYFRKDSSHIRWRQLAPGASAYRPLL